MAIFAFHKVVRRQYSGELSKFKCSYVNCSCDSVHQRLLKSVDFFADLFKIYI